MIPLGVLGSARHQAAAAGGEFLQSTMLTTGGTVSTHTGSIGAPAPDRVVAVLIFGRKGATSSAVIQSVTIGGIAATIAVQDGTVTGSTVGVAYATVPTETTANVVVTWSESMARTGMGWWRIPGAGAPTCSASGAYRATSVSMTAESGFSIAAVACGNVNSGTWDGATERYDEAIGSSAHAGADTTAAGPVTFTNASSQSVSYVIATFTGA